MIHSFQKYRNYAGSNSLRKLFWAHIYKDIHNYRQDYKYGIMNISMVGKQWMDGNYRCITRKGMNICFPFRNNWVLWNMTCVAWILNAIFHTRFHVINLSCMPRVHCHNMTITSQIHLAFCVLIIMSHFVCVVYKTYV